MHTYWVYARGSLVLNSDLGFGFLFFGVNVGFEDSDVTNLGWARSNRQGFS